MKPIVGIVGNHKFTQLHTENLTLSASPDGFIKGIQQGGGLAMILPISHPDLARDYVDSVSGIILAGGQDVSPLLYGEEPHPKLGTTYPLRDEFEMAVIRAAYEQKKPILAICRGLQMLNVALGGTLYQDISSQYKDLSVLHNQQTPPSSPSHSVKIDPESMMASIFPNVTRVNSYHHQAIKSLGEGLKAVAWSSDDIIEGIESTDCDHFILGVQWHPETMIHKNAEMQGLFTYFVDHLHN